MSTKKIFNAQCRLDETQASQIKQIAEEHNVPVSVVMRWAVIDYLESKHASAV